jgi:hypothetical protein
MPMTHYLLLLARLCGVLLYAGGLEAAFVAGGTGPLLCCGGPLLAVLALMVFRPTWAGLLP